MDPFDRAQELEMIQREEAIAKQRMRFTTLAAAPGIEVALDCVECGVEIPAQRREALPGVFRCVDCQQIHEQQQKRGI